MLPGHRRLCTLILLSALLAPGGQSLRAQDSTSIVAMTACTDHLPPSVFNRVAVYAYVHVDPGANKDVRWAGENFLPDVAAAVARLLRAPTGALPAADSAVDWRWVNGSIRVIAFRDGRMTWYPGPAPHSDGATHLLARALASADSAGARIPLLADGDHAAPDSIVFWIKTKHADVDLAGHGTAMKFEGTALPIFSLPVPSFEPSRLPRGSPYPHYPEDARDDGIEATVIEEYIVDTTGRVVPESIHEVEGVLVPPQGKDRDRRLSEFVAAIRTVLDEFRFTPALLGGCVVSEHVRQPFQFSLGRRWPSRPSRLH